MEKKERVVKEYERKKKTEVQKRCKQHFYKNSSHQFLFLLGGSLCLAMANVFPFSIAAEGVLACLGLGSTAGSIPFMIRTIGNSVNLASWKSDREYDDKNISDYIEYYFYKEYETKLLDKLKDYLISIGKYDDCKINEEDFLDSIQDEINTAYKKFYNENKETIENIKQDFDNIKNNNSDDKKNIETFMNKIKDKMDVLKESTKQDINNSISVKHQEVFKAPTRNTWQSISISKPVKAIKSCWNSFTSLFSKKPQQIEINNIDDIATTINTNNTTKQVILPEINIKINNQRANDISEEAANKNQSYTMKNMNNNISKLQSEHNSGIIKDNTNNIQL